MQYHPMSPRHPKPSNSLATRMLPFRNSSDPAPGTLSCLTDAVVQHAHALHDVIIEPFLDIHMRVMPLNPGSQQWVASLISSACQI